MCFPAAMMTKPIKSTSTSASTWTAWKRSRLVRRSNRREQKWGFLRSLSHPTLPESALDSFSATVSQCPPKKWFTRSGRCWKLTSQVVFPSPGPEPTLFGKPKFCCMRLHYKNEETSGYFHTLRAATRNPEDDGKGGDFSRGRTSSLCIFARICLDLQCDVMSQTRYSA